MDVVVPESSQPTRRAYVVDITYREPGYAQRSGTDKPYGSRFLVEAIDERDAIAQAEAEFKALAQKSGVGWVRVIERIDCRQISGPEGEEMTNDT
jgi:hypothetical protein